jgi:hypothetical protein
MKSAAGAALLLIWCAASVSASSPGAGADDDRPSIATGTIVESPAPAAVSTAPIVGSIRIERTNVFDPAVVGEDWWGFRFANKLHAVTREKVVRDELLFGPGERWDDLKIIESERNLRFDYPFRRVEISKVPRADGRVDAVVRTQDAWTTLPKIGVGTSGGQSTASIGLEEGNILGYGKAFGYDHAVGNSTNGRVRADSITYQDPRFLRTRLGLMGSYTRTQDGDSDAVAFNQPYYSLDTAHAANLAWSNANGVGSEVRDGAVLSNYFERRRVVDAAYGWRLEPDRWFVQRVEAGWYEDDARFATTAAGPGTLPGTLPADRHLSGPTVGYSWVQPRYLKETFIDRIERVEDFNLGNELHMRTGYMARGTGADQDRWIFNATDRQGVSLGVGRFALAEVGVSGRLFNNRWENGLATANLNFFWKNYAWLRNRTLVAHVEAAQGRRLDRENQIVLGGSTGLRGYKNDAFVGGRSILMNLEDRFFFDGEWFHLARFGGAAFVESGAVVPEGSGFSPTRFRSDVGAGLRATSTRSASGGVVRFDVAYALNGGPGGSRWVVSLRGGQAFSFFNSASERVVRTPSSQQ